MILPFYRFISDLSGLYNEYREKGLIYIVPIWSGWALYSTIYSNRFRSTGTGFPNNLSYISYFKNLGPLYLRDLVSATIFVVVVSAICAVNKFVLILNVVSAEVNEAPIYGSTFYYILLSNIDIFDDKLLFLEV